MANVKLTSVYAQITARLDKYEKDLAKARGMTNKSAGLIQKRINKISFRDATKSMAGFADSFQRLQRLALVGFAGYGAKNIASSFLDVAESFEQMEAKLDIVTKGQGLQTLEKINKWALELPISTAEVTQAFVRMSAMGLKPTMGRMEALANVAAVMGDDILPRLSLQLGQAAAKGKIMQQDINIMGEAGVDVAKYLRDAFGMTVQDLQKSGIDIQKQLQVIFDGMARDFDGSIERMAKTWRGLKAVARSYFTEIQRQVMAAGVFDELKKQLEGVNEQMKTWLMLNSELIKIKVPEYVANVKTAIQKIWDLLTYDPAIVEYGVIGLVVFGRKGAALLGGLAHLGNVMEVQAKAFKALVAGQLTFGEVASANYTELKRLVDGLGELNDGLVAAHGNATRMGDALQSAHGMKYTTGGGFGGETKAKARPTLPQVAPPFDMSAYKYSDKDSYRVMVKDSKLAFEQMTADVDAYKYSTSESYRLIVEDSAEGYRVINDTAEETFSSINQLSERTAWAMQENFSNLFFDAMQGKLNSFKDYASSILDSIQRAIADVASQSVVTGLFGDVGTAGTGAGGWLSKLFNPDKSMANGGYLGEGVRGIGVKTGQSYEFHPNEIVSPAGKAGGGIQNIINVTNATGTPADVQQTSAWVSADKMVTDIVLNKKMTSRGFRQGLRA